MNRFTLRLTAGFLLGFAAGLCVSIWAVGTPLREAVTEFREAGRLANEATRRLESMFKP